MDSLQIVFLFSAGIGALYMLIYALLTCAARKTLAEAYQMEDRTIRIYAKAGSLEYDLRCALMAAGFEKIKIVVHIPRHDTGCSEMREIVRFMRRRHKNISYKMI